VPEHTLLLSTKHVSLGLSRCGPIPAGHSEEEIETGFILVFPLAGVFGVDSERSRTSVMPTKAVLFSMDQSRRVHHPGGGHDRSAFISMDPEFAEPFLSPTGRFRMEAANTTPPLDLRLRYLIASAAAGHFDALEVEEFAAGALAELMEKATFTVPGEQRDVILNAEAYLSVHFREGCDLDTMAREVGYSTHHLSRLFKQVTGETISRRRIRLRLAYAVSEIVEGSDDLAKVAVESGFYDHSHMTETFRSHLGLRPSEIKSEFGTLTRSSRPSHRGLFARPPHFPH